MLKFMGKLGREEGQVSRLQDDFLLLPSDFQRCIQHPQQLPLVVEVGRAVIDRIYKNIQSLQLMELNDLQFTKKKSPPGVFYIIVNHSKIFNIQEE